jgi:hypothetical protein
MNRHAAVLAADSASTVTRWVDGKLETRYFKGANKIFQLSHHQPVGLMILNAADLLHVPWEILIKSFRDKLAAKTFNNLDGYAEEFFAFLDNNTQFFPEEVQNEELSRAAQGAAIQIVFSVVENLDQLKEADSIAKLRTVIDSKNKLLESVALPKRITAEHAQLALVAHRTASQQLLPIFVCSRLICACPWRKYRSRRCSKSPRTSSVRPASFLPATASTIFSHT